MFCKNDPVWNGEDNTDVLVIYGFHVSVRSDLEELLSNVKSTHFSHLSHWTMKEVLTKEKEYLSGFTAFIFQNHNLMELWLQQLELWIIFIGI